MSGHSACGSVRSEKNQDRQTKNKRQDLPEALISTCRGLASLMLLHKRHSSASTASPLPRERVARQRRVRALLPIDQEGRNPRRVAGKIRPAHRYSRVRIQKLSSTLRFQNQKTEAWPFSLSHLENYFRRELDDSRIGRSRVGSKAGDRYELPARQRVERRSRAIEVPAIEHIERLDD